MVLESNHPKGSVEGDGVRIIPQYIENIIDPLFTTKEKSVGLLDFSILRNN